MAMLTMEQIEELRQFDSCTVSNAIESFNVRPRTEGFMGYKVKSVIPISKPMVGYARTGKIIASKPLSSGEKDLAVDWYRYIKMSPKPCIAVQQDVDDVPIGSFWGEVQVSTHKALGCSGVITNGGLRDLDEVAAMGFGYFASCVLVSHAYVHTIEFDMPVSVAGLLVRPGDLLHADKHGVVLIPEEIAPKIADACRKVQYYEEPVIKGCKARFDTGVTIEELTAFRQEMAKRR